MTAESGARRALITGITGQDGSCLAEFLPALRFPHPLDADNTDKAALVLPPCWYAQ